MIDWSQGLFKILGVNFSSEVYTIWDLNAREIYAKTENLCQQKEINSPG